MTEVEFSELPEDLRVKLTEKSREELWRRADEFGGVKTLSESFEFSQSKMYNWRNKDLALPLKFVKRLMGQNSTDEIIMLKGRGSSTKIENPEFPIQFSRELLTRASVSVKKNSDGTPFYLTGERGLAERFVELLQNIGEVEYSFYSRNSRFEVRYPKFLNQIFEQVDFNREVAAEIDEKGQIVEEKIVLPDREILISEFNGDLYSREKSFEIALQRGNSDKIAELMAEESSKVRKMIGN